MGQALFDDPVIETTAPTDTGTRGKALFDDPVIEGQSTSAAPLSFARGFARGAGIEHPLNTVNTLTGAEDIPKAIEQWKSGDKHGAALTALKFAVSTPFGPGMRMIEGVVDNAKTQAHAAMDAIHKGDYAGAIAHSISVHPLAASLGDAVDEIKNGNVEGGLGLIAGNATAVGAAGAVAAKAPQIAEATAGASKLVTPSGLVRAAEVIRHPVRTAVAAGLDMAAEAMKRKNAAVINPPALPVQPVAVATPPPLPPPALPPQVPAMASNGLPVRPPLRSTPAVEPPPVAVQPPIEPFDAAGNVQANAAADAASGVKSKSGLIAMLERRKILTIGDKALLAKLKAEVAESQPVSEQPATISPDVPRGTSMPPVGDLRGDQAYLNASDETGLSAKSPQEIGNRTAKAQRFINKLGGTQNLPRTQAEWTTLADSMGEKTPSPETQDLITKGLNTRMVKGVEKPGTPAQSLEDQLQDSIRLARLKKSFPFETQEQLMERLKK